MTSDFLAGLDAAVEQRCACLCGRPITAASPSAYFASERCAQRWHTPAGADLPVDLAEVARMLADLLRAAAEAFRRAAQQIARALARVAAQLAAAAEAVPEKPAGRDVRPRPPLRLDPPGGLRAQALGRPAWRPAS